MKPYLYAMGAVLCWASLPAATGSGLDGLSVPELLFFSFQRFLNMRLLRFQFRIGFAHLRH